MPTLRTQPGSFSTTRVSRPRLKSQNRSSVYLWDNSSEKSVVIDQMEMVRETWFMFYILWLGSLMDLAHYKSQGTETIYVITLTGALNKDTVCTNHSFGWQIHVSGQSLRQRSLPLLCGSVRFSVSKS